ncbi:hypothetical protein D3C81_2178660 [compost metagenome]
MVEAEAFDPAFEQVHAIADGHCTTLLDEQLPKRFLALAPLLSCIGGSHAQ